MNRLALIAGITLSICYPVFSQVETHNHACIETHNNASLQPTRNPLVFFHETFNWKNPADPKGWTMPANVYLEDPDDTGLNWHWWPNDSLKAIVMAEPPFQSSTKEDGHLCLFGAHYNDFEYTINNIPINNSVVFTGIDCSQHPSVILQFETTFKNSGIPGHVAGGYECSVDVSGDNGYHWSTFDASFGVAGSGRPYNVEPGQPAIFKINITEVASGMSNVMVRIRWYSYFGWYYWIIDDLKMYEALPNDLHINYVDVEWDDKIFGIDQSISYTMPISQIARGHGFFKFRSGITNMGATEATNIEFDLTIRHEDQVVYQESATQPVLYAGYKDSLALQGRYEPTAKGKYTLEYRWRSDKEDDYPTDNVKTLNYYITDSVYNRSCDTPDCSISFNSSRWIRDEWALYANVNHFMCSAFPIYGECEIDGLSAYITGGLADGKIDFDYTVWLADYYAVTNGYIDPRFLMKTERVNLDSAMFNKWIYMPFDKNGEDEFIPAGSLLWAGVEYSNWHNVDAVRRDKGMSIGGTTLSPPHEARTMYSFPYSQISTGRAWSYSAKANVMIRLHLHSHANSTNLDISASSALVVTQNYPNPFTDQTVINYQVGIDSPVRLEIADLTGRKVLVRDEGPKPPGRHQILIQDAGLAPGVYFYTVYAGANRETKRMMVAGL